MVEIGFLTSYQETKFRYLEMEILWSRNEKENFYLTLLLRKEAHVSVSWLLSKKSVKDIFFTIDSHDTTIPFEFWLSQLAHL